MVFSFLRQEVLRAPFETTPAPRPDQASPPRHARSGSRIWRSSRRHRGWSGPVSRKRSSPPRIASNTGEQTVRPRAARHPARWNHGARTTDTGRGFLRRDDPASEQSAPAPRAHGGHQVAQTRARRARRPAPHSGTSERPIERLVRPWHLGFVRHLETGVQSASSGNSRSIDRQNASIVLIATSAVRVTQLTPATRRKLASRPAARSVSDDALAHLGGCLPRERERQNLRGIDTFAQQVDVAIDEHARLARPCRRFERHVESRIDGSLAAPIGSRASSPRFFRDRVPRQRAVTAQSLHVVLPAHGGYAQKSQMISSCGCAGNSPPPTRSTM